jgi:hypothetical protein
VKCSNENCCGETELFEESREAIEKWNHRPVEQALLEALKAAVYELCHACPGENQGENSTCKQENTDCFVKKWLDLIKKTEDCHTCDGAGKNREDVEYIGDCKNCGLLIFSDDEWGKDAEGILLCKPCMENIKQGKNLFCQRNKTT